MSIGAPSNLGTLLVQRLDAVLGTTLGQQSNLASGAGPLAVPQPGNPENPDALQNPGQRHPREAVDQASQQGRQQAAVGKAMRDMQLDNLLGRGTTFQGTTQSAPTTLGYAARIILALLNQFPQDGQAVRGQAALLSNPALGQAGTLATRFAQALPHAVQTSGLFYESHLAQLAAGRATPQTLRQEPQGRLPAPPAAHTPTAATGQPALPPEAPLLAGRTSGPDTVQAGPTPPHSTSAPGIDPQVQLLVRQQLEVLANQGFIWQGEAWPGTDMQWEVHRHPQDDEAGQGIQTGHWSTRLTLQLPTLGEVRARLSLSGDQLLMQLVAPESAGRLGKAIEPLRARLQALGLQASQLSVQTQDDTPSAPSPDPQPHDSSAS